MSNVLILINEIRHSDVYELNEKLPIFLPLIQKDMAVIAVLRGQVYSKQNRRYLRRTESLNCNTFNLEYVVKGNSAFIRRYMESQYEPISIMISL